MGKLEIGVVVTANQVGSRDAEGGNYRLDPDALDLASGIQLVKIINKFGFEATLLEAANLDRRLRDRPIDACFLALHGPVGGRGHIQAILAHHGVPFAGPPADVVSLAYDKVRSRQLLAFHNLPVPASVALGDKEIDGRALELLGWPCVVKPRRGSRGAGVQEVASLAEVADAVDEALLVDTELVLERAIRGPEFQVVLVGDRVLGTMQIHRDATGEAMQCPPDLSRGRLDGIHNLARRASRALGVDRWIARVDILLSPRHNEVVLEVEPLPPMHAKGTVARVARAYGTSLDALVAEQMATLMKHIDARSDTHHAALQ